MQKKYLKSLFAKAYSVFTVFMMLSTNFMPALYTLHTLPNFASAKDVTPTEVVAEQPGEQTISSIDEIPVEVMPITSQPVEEAITPAPVIEEIPEVPVLEVVPIVEKTQAEIIPQAEELVVDEAQIEVTPELESPVVDETPVVEVTVIDSGEGTLTNVVNSTIYDCLPNTIVSCVISDKDDYAPTDIVNLTGYGYEPSSDYNVIIYSTDLPEVRVEIKVTSDEDGTFKVSYQLDGKYRPQYYVEVHSIEAKVVAKTSFKDSPVSGCVNDSAGANDEPGQKDLTKMCVNYSGLPTSISLSWNWDDTSWSGANTGNACSLLDSDLDGLANYALCEVVYDNPAVHKEFHLYSCTDTSAVRCYGSVDIPYSAPTSCTASVVANSNPFTAGNSDTVGSCTLAIADVSNAQLIDVCSYPSNSPNSDPSDCIMFKTDSGKLEVVKNLIPSTDSGLFNLQIDGVTQATNIGDDGSTGDKVVDEGNHTVGETAGTGTSLSDYTSSIVCKDLNGTGSTVASSSNSGPLTVDIDEGDDIQCVITNTRKSATLIVKKVVVGSTELPSSFSFAINGGGTQTFESDGQNDFILDPGTYNVVETTHQYFNTTYDNCASIVLDNNETETCTITNTLKPSTLTVEKTVINNNGGTKVVSDFNLYINGSQVTSGTQNSVVAGSHTVTEDNLTGYSASVWGGSCASNGTVTVNPGENKTCTITNDDIAPELTVIKHVINDNGGTAIASDFTMNVSGTNVSDNSFNGAETPGVTVTLNAGSFSVNETKISGYADSYSGDCNTTIALGEKKTCTITNNDVSPELTVIKHVVTDNGGDAVASDFTMNVTGTNVSDTSFVGDELGTTVTLDAGNYNVTETTIFGYADSYSTDCTGTIALGEKKTCTITNDDIQPTLTVTKIVQNYYGGTLLVSNFNLLVDITTEVESGVANGFNAGTYVVSEEAVFGYTGNISGACDSNGTVVLEVGDEKNCIITNTDVQPTLTVIKTVINNNGGTAVASDFTINVTGTNVSDSSFTGEANPGTPLTLNAGSYSVIEGDHTGYAVSYSPDCSGSIDIGEQKTCTITNNDIAPKLTVIKSVVNDNGGTAVASDFTMNVTGTNVSETSFAGDELGTTVTLDAGSYSVDEGLNNDYAKTLGANCSGTIAIGQEKTCTITNDDIAPELTVVKTVTNDNGGTLSASDFPLYVNATSVVSGVKNEFNAGTYVVSETTQTGYAPSVWGGDCASDGEIVLRAGDSKTCTITNNDIQPTLTVVKTVINDNGGTLSVSDFPLYVDDTLVVSGTGNGFDADDYVVSEIGQTGYAASIWGGDCASNGDITLNVGDNKTCTITNDDISPELTVVKHVVTDNGGTAVASDFTMNVAGTNVSDTSFVGDELGTKVTLDAGSYEVTETTVFGYADTYSTDCGGTIALGEKKTCTVTNDDIQPKLTVTKLVNNYYGGALQVSNFDLFVDVTTTVVSGESNGFNVGNYIVSEEDVFGYTGVISGACDSNGNVTLNVGDDKECFITNTDIQPQLTIIKHVINDDGGDAVASDFTMYVNGTNVSNTSFSGAETPGVIVTLDAGVYTVTEGDHTGYADNYSTDCSGTIAVGESRTCTITNDDIAPKLNVIKHVINDNGGTLGAADFTMNVTGTNVSDASFSGAENPGVTVTLDAGGYSVDEDLNDDYNKTIGNDCSGFIAIGEEKTCTITNNDIAPELTVVKTVTNDNGGTLSVSDFPLYVGDTPVVSGVENEFNAGTYFVKETTQTGYAPSVWGGDCASDGEIALNIGDSKTCTITNNDISPVLTVVKTVMNDNGGTLSVSDFPLYVDDTLVVSGTENTFDAGEYMVSEIGQTGYAPSVWGGDCASDGEIILSVGDSKTCTITNDDVQPLLTVTKTVTNDNGGQKEVEDFPLYVGDTGVISGVQNGFNSDQYTLSETGSDDYTASVWGGDCGEDGTITLLPGDIKTCTITNDDKPGYIVVNKEFDNTLDGFDNFEPNNELAQSLGIQWTAENLLTNALHSEWGTSVELNVGSYNIIENYDGDFEYAGYIVGDDVSCNDLYDRTDLSSLNDGTSIEIVGGETTYLTFCNKLVEPRLEILKTNNASTDKVIGDLVEYTIEVSVKDAKVYNLSVMDILPESFRFVSGSQSVSLNGINQPFSGSLPYNPISEWDLSDLGVLEPDDVVVLKYLAEITAAVDPGLYKDIAWAKAQGGAEIYLSRLFTSLSGRFTALDPEESNVIYAQGIGSWTDGTNYVGSEVNVVSRAVAKEGVVLGVKTVQLPDTGMGIAIIIASVLSLLSGIALVAFGLGKKLNRKMLTKALTVVAGLVFFSSMSGNSFAIVNNLVVRLEVPKTEVNSEFKVDYIVLSKQQLNITVECQVKKPTDIGFSAFGTNNVILNTFGGTGECLVDSAVLDDGDGEYRFKVFVNSIPSDEVLVKLTTTKPLTPVEFKKTEVGACKYNIEFKTAADSGKTVKVEVYRSTQTSFTADASTYAGSVNIGSDTEGSFENTKPNCSKTYYYAIRAVDVAGNTSGFIGDTILVTLPGQVINTGPGAGTGTGAGGATDNGAVQGETDTGANKDNDGKVEGETDTDKDNDGKTDTDTANGENKDKDDGTLSWKTVLIWSIGSVLGIIIIWQLIKLEVFQSLFQAILRLFKK